MVQGDSLRSGSPYSLPTSALGKQLLKSRQGKEDAGGSGRIEDMRIKNDQERKTCRMRVEIHFSFKYVGGFQL